MYFCRIYGEFKDWGGFSGSRKTGSTAILTRCFLQQKEARVNNQDKVTSLFRMVSLTCVQSQTGSICQTSAFGVIRLPDRSHRARCKCTPETGVWACRRWECARERADKAGSGPNLNALCKRGVMVRLYIPFSSPPPCPLLPPQQIQQRKRNVSKRVRQNKAVGSANNHGAPWPCVGNEGREGRRNVRRVVLMKGIAVLSAVHSANCWQTVCLQQASSSPLKTLDKQGGWGDGSSLWAFWRA